jgi:Alg9-like mannosyltransferase family
MTDRGRVYYIVDAAAVLAAAVAVAIARTGGWSGAFGGIRIRATSASSAVAVALLLLGIRAAFGEGRFLAIPFLDVNRIRDASLDAWCRVSARLESERAAFRTALFVAAASLVIRLANIVVHGGFWTGDDVEIHEMTLGRLFGVAWPVWDLRCAFYPMVFVYPVQAAVFDAGWHGVTALVLAARVSLALWSTADIVIVYAIGVRLWSAQAGAFAAVILACAKLGLISGSVELPAAVASCFLLIAFWLLHDAPGRRVAVPIAAIALGIAAALRFSEAIFLLPAAASLLLRRESSRAVVLVAIAIATTLCIIGIADAWYWGQPFYSLRHIVDFTLVRRLSSRGYQAWYAYLNLNAWTDIVTAGLALYPLATGRWNIALWTWLPVLTLSVLPHKEPRYLMPMMPFLALSAGIGLAGITRAMFAAPRSTARMMAAVLWIACALGVALEVPGFNFRRTDADVRLAERLAEDGTLTGAAVEQSWRVGGHLYLPRNAVLIDLDRARFPEPAFLPSVVSNPAIGWILLLKVDAALERTLGEAGFVPTEVAADVSSAYRVYRRR